MAVVNTKHCFVYLAHPHTASRAAVRALLDIEGSREVAAHHSVLDDVIAECPAAAGYMNVFTIVRHPFDWLVSRFHCTGGNRGEWDDWLRRRPSRPLFGRFLGQVTEFGKYESLQEDLERLTQCPIHLNREREHETRGKPRDYRTCWTEAQATWGRQRFDADFAEWNYE